MSIAANLSSINHRIHASARRANRNPEDIVLMAVSKTQPPERIREAYAAGQRLFGENRVQEFSEKSNSLSDLRDAEWHMIGHLQSNKAVKAAELFAAVDSVDSLKIAEKLNAAARDRGNKLQVLIEINVGGEAAKSGLAADSSELEMLLTAAPRFDALTFRGLMTVPPFTEDPQGARNYFRKLGQLRDTLASRKLPGITLEELSMGMSHDFEVAIEEGSTCVRVGTAIFGERHKP